MIILYGKSGSGKTEIEKSIVKNFDIQPTTSITSRPMRKHEVDGEDYYFKSQKFIVDLAKQGELAEFIVYNDEYYALEMSQCGEDKITVMIPEGIEQIKTKKNLNPFIVYIRASVTTRRQRMLARGDLKFKVDSRIDLDEEVFKEVRDIADLVVNNEINNKKNIEKIAKQIVKEYNKFLGR